VPPPPAPATTTTFATGVFRRAPATSIRQQSASRANACAPRRQPDSRRRTPYGRTCRPTNRRRKPTRPDRRRTPSSPGRLSENGTSRVRTRTHCREIRSHPFPPVCTLRTAAAAAARLSSITIVNDHVLNGERTRRRRPDPGRRKQYARRRIPFAATE